MFARPAKVLCLCLLVAAGLCGALNPGAAQAAKPAAPDTQIMDWLFAMPQGWQVANSRLTTLTTSLLALEETERASQVLTQVTFGRPEDLRGSFTAWYNAHWANLLADYAFADVSEPAESESATGYRLINGGGVAALPNGGKRAVLLIGVSKGKRAGVLCFITEDLDQLPANGKRLEAMLGSISFASQRAKSQVAPKLNTRIDPQVTPSFLWDKPAAWPKGEMPLEGLWGSPSFEVENYSYYGFTTRSSYSYFLFFKDGHVLRMMPREGLLNFDIEFSNQQYADKLCKYTVEGETVSIVRPDGSNDTTLTLKNGDLYRANGKLLRPIKQQTPVLSGRYISIDHERHGWQFRQGITFWPNGAFADEGFNSLLALRWWCGGNYWLVDQPAQPGKGNWRIEKNTLELTYTDGRKRRFGFNLHVKEDGTRDMDGQHEQYLVLNSKYMTRLSDPAGPAPDLTVPTPPPEGTPDTQLNDWVFAMPADWMITSGGPGVPVLASRNAGKGVTSWAETVATAETTDFKTWFDTQWKALARQYGITEADPAQGGPNAAKYDLLARAGLGKMDGANALVMLAAMHRGGRAGALAFVSTDMANVATEIEAMDALLASASLASCRTKDEPAPRLGVCIDRLCTPSFLWPEAAPVAGNGALQGIYTLSGQRAVSADGKTEPGLWYLTFFADGTVIRQLPPEGLLNFRMDYWRQYYTSDCGTWQINGDSVAVTLARPNGTPESLWFTRKGDTLEDGRLVYRRIADAQPRPEGRYLRQGWETRDKKLQLGITFNADGTFKDEGIGATLALAWWCGSNFVLRDSLAGQKPGQGKWRVAQNTLELIYSDGRKRRIGCHLHETEGTKYLVLNGELLVKP